MKKVLILMLSFLFFALFLAACSDIANITLPQDNSSSEIARNDNTIIWTGKGIGSLAEECGDEGYIHWVLNQAKNVTSAELILGGSGSGTCSPVKITKGGVYQFTTPYFDLETLEAYVTYVGDIKKNTSLIISEYCPGEDSGEITVTAPFSIELTWPATTEDLDAALIIPEGTLINQWLGVISDGNATHSGDAWDWGGTETFTVANLYTGTWNYYVGDYWVTGNKLIGSGAVVTISDISGVVATFNVSTDEAGTINFWRVFTIDGDTGVVTPVNIYNDIDPVFYGW